MPHQIKPLIFDNYLALIKNSVGSKTWQNFYVKINGKKCDVMRSGDLSCAFFVSSLLALLGLIKRPHATVNSTLSDMENSGWHKIKKPKIGSILLWESQMGADGESHRHLGFYIGRHKAVSNSSSSRMPLIHHWTFGKRSGKPKRKIEAIFWHPKLG